MAYLKPDSVPAQAEIQANKACQIIAKKSKESLAKNRKSSVITSHFIGEDSPELGPPFNKPFGRG